MFLFVTVFAGCPEPEKPDTGPVTHDSGPAACGDPEDGDGWCPDEGDCDNNNADVHPGAEEICNGIDDNCDGVVDEDVEATFYADADGDGFGDPLVTQVGCEPSRGFVQNGTDCDDTSGEAYPGKDEQCDGVDDDCDGAVDEDAIDAPTWYLDFDGDGFGTDLLTAIGCDAPAGYVADTSDCDDTSADVSPAGSETCDGRDEDCDGGVDEDLAVYVYYTDADGDGYGDPASAASDCTLPTGVVTDGTDCDDTSADVSPGITETCDGVDQDCSGVIDDGGACP